MPLSTQISLDDVIEDVAAEAQDIASISADYRRANGVRKQSLLDSITIKIDELLGLMLVAFEGTVSKEDAQSLLKDHHPLTETRLARLQPNEVPLVVMRELVAVHQAPIRRDRLQNWLAFSNRYRHSIV